MRFIFCSLVIAVCAIILSSCGNSNNTNDADSMSNIKSHGHAVVNKDSHIKYDSSSAISGWVALYDKNEQMRCYMSSEAYYSIKEPNMNGNLKDEYSFLIPLGMVLKYSGANIIWGFDGVESVSLNEAMHYVGNYSPDGNKWRLLTKVEAYAICENIKEFVDNFRKFNPNNLCLDTHTNIENWISGQSNETWLRRINNRHDNKIYTLDIYGEEGRIHNEYTDYEKDRHNVYPISSL